MSEHTYDKCNFEQSCAENFKSIPFLIAFEFAHCVQVVLSTRRRTSSSKSNLHMIYRDSASNWGKFILVPS